MVVDKNKLIEIIKSSKPQDILVEPINSVDKNSVNRALNQVQKFIGKSDVLIVVIKK